MLTIDNDDTRSNIVDIKTSWLYSYDKVGII